MTELTAEDRAHFDAIRRQREQPPPQANQLREWDDTLARAHNPDHQDPETLYELEARIAAREAGIDRAALYGLAGRVVTSVGPHTEASAVGLLVTFLASFGAAVGRGPHAVADGAEHPGRLAVVLVGRSAKTRKGTTWTQIRRIMAVADPRFIADRVLGGFGSGEALVDAVAAGEDHRMLVVEPEWARVLAVGRRDGSTLSPLLRQAWDGDRLAIRSRNGTTVADGANVATIGHVTLEELRAKLLEVEIANGYANRHLFVEVSRSKRLPTGGNFDESAVDELGRQVRDALDKARRIGILHRTPAAEDRWANLYDQMADDDPGGLVGAIIARDSAQVLRLSVVYALTDGSRQIDMAHLEAAWAVWRYCRKSVASIFAERSGDPIADRLLTAARAAGPDGLSTEAQHAALGRHTPAARLRMARELLVSLDLATVRRVPTSGRTAEILVAGDSETSEVGETR